MAVCVAFSFILLLVGGCTFGNSAIPQGQAVDTSEQVGVYPEPPHAIAVAKTKPPVVVAPLKIDVPNADPTLGSLSAEALYGLLEQTGRFDLSKRAAFTKATTGSGASSQEEAALAAEAHEAGAAYLVMGRVLQLSVEPVTDEGWLKNAIGTITADKYNPNDPASTVNVTVEVELRFIRVDSDSTSEAAKVVFTRQAKAEELQITLGGYVSPTDHRRLQTPVESQVQLVRYGLDNAIRKMLPNLDQSILIWSFDKGF
jgi:curli biogenesis system outer membrane secretion channel CsgG